MGRGRGGEGLDGGGDGTEGREKNSLWEEEYIQYNRDLVTALLRNCGCNSQFPQMVISTIEGDQVMSGGMINHHLSEQQLATATASGFSRKGRTFRVCESVTLQDNGVRLDSEDQDISH